MWIPTEMRIWVVETTGRILHQGAVAEWRRIRVDQLVFRSREIVGDPVGRADGRAAVARDIPCHADARRQIPPLRLEARPARRETAIARIDETRRRILEHRGPDVAAEVIVAVVVDGVD